jgi:hypothetical protein
VLLARLHRTSPVQYREGLQANLDPVFFTLGAFVKGCLDAKPPGAAVLVSSNDARARHDVLRRRLPTLPA